MRFIIRCLLLVVTSVLVMACSTTPPPSPTPKKPIVALVLGGGGARGFAHLGVIETLENNGISPDIVIGTSAGALVGALYASGKSPSELQMLADDFDINAVLEIRPAKQGLIDGTKLRHYVNQHAGANPTKFPKKFAAVATDTQGQAVIFSNGETGLIVQASASVPKLFIAPRIPDKVGNKYVDGGVSALVPARFARELGADVVIAVDILGNTAMTNPVPNSNVLDNTVLDNGILDNGILDNNILDNNRQAFASGRIWQKLSNPTATMATIDKQAADVIITPDLKKISVLDISQKTAMIQAGRIATVAQLAPIQTAITQSTP